MDEKHSGYSLKAPGRASSSPAVRLPGRDPFPRVDDHLVEPEVTRDEIIGGRKVVAHPALEPHADQHTELDYLLRAHVAPGYRVSADLITRYDVDSDFASDVCLRREGIDPETGVRYLEEVAFEVVSEQTEARVAQKAPRMLRRGVRRVFGLFVKGERRVAEWDSKSCGWRILDRDAVIDDPSLAKPVRVATLLDAAESDNAVVEALATKGNLAIRKREAAARAEERTQAVLTVLGARGITLTEAQRREILSCQDSGRLDRWLQRAAVASTADEVLAET